jgi:hypothetical protein
MMATNEKEKAHRVHKIAMGEKCERKTLENSDGRITFSA